MVDYHTQNQIEVSEKTKGGRVKERGEKVKCRERIGKRGYGGGDILEEEAERPVRGWRGIGKMCGLEGENMQARGAGKGGEGTLNAKGSDKWG